MSHLPVTDGSGSAATGGEQPLTNDNGMVVTDTNGNVYKRALTVGNTHDNITLGMYYAENIKGGSNVIKVHFRFNTAFCLPLTISCITLASCTGINLFSSSESVMWLCIFEL